MRRVEGEHILQTRLKMWVRESLMVPHKFFAFDRSPARGWRHAREKARGIQRSTPDTLLISPGLPIMWAELKSPRLNLDDDKFRKTWPDQWRMGQELIHIGCLWGWFQSIAAYDEWIGQYIPLSSHARWLAVKEDATVASLIETAEMKTGKLPARLKEAKPTVAQVRRFEKARPLPP